MTTYNGYSNYETWNVNLWLNNDPGSYDFIYKLANDESQSDYEKAQALKEFVNENNPLADSSSLYSDLLQNALGAVDWDEIIKANQEENEP